MNIQKRKWLWWIFPILIMGGIFWMSSQDGTESSAMSDSLVLYLVRFLGWLTGEMISTDSAVMLFLVFLVRKAAHMIEFGLLAVAFYVALFHTTALSEMKKIGLSWGLAVLYSVTDEIHQLFVPGRTSRGIDVLIDSTGAAIAVFVVAVWCHYRRKTRCLLKNRM